MIRDRCAVFSAAVDQIVNAALILSEDDNLVGEIFDDNEIISRYYRLQINYHILPANGVTFN